MSQATLDKTTPQPTPPPPEPRSRTSASRLLIVALLVAGLTVSALARLGAQRLRMAPALTPAGQASTAAAGQGITGMNSFALALLLGGLRGPLVMILWTSSESQKTERQLEDFDTKVEWIRLLQPEFDSVHLFQIWNKAYNISVQVASLSNKYSTILDAIDYARDVDAERPNNINIIHEIGRVYFDKLGNSHEKVYFTRRLREESLMRPGQRVLARTDPGWRRIEHDPMLDPDGNILPELLQPRPRLAMGSPGSEEGYYDGSELAYLAPYQPFPYGLSPFSVGYNYFKRAQVLQTAGRQRHIQIGPMAIHSRPAVAMMFWSEEELARGRRAELRAFARPMPADDVERHLAAADLALDQQPVDHEAIPEALYGYDMASRLAADALPEYQSHLRLYDINRDNYLGHMDHLRALGALAAADRDYLRAMLATGDDRQNLLAEAARGYQQAVDQTTLVILRYYLDVRVVRATFPEGRTRYTAPEMSAAQRWDILNRALRYIEENPGYYSHAEERPVYEAMVARAMQRLEQLPR